MTLRTYTPKARVTITLAASGDILDVTDDLISLATNKAFGMAAGGWQISLPPRILAKYGKAYDDLIETDDLVVIDIDAGDGTGFERVMLGLVSRISRVSNYAMAGIPQRFVKVTGQDMGKLLLKHDCGWDISSRPEVYGNYTLIRQSQGVFFTGTAETILDSLFDTLFCKQVSRMADYYYFSANTDDPCQVYDWSVMSTTGSIWNAMKQLANEPYNILSTETDPDTDKTIFNITLEKTPIDDAGKLTRPEYQVIDPEDVIASDIGRCDDERVTYEWLKGFMTVLGVDTGMPIQSVIAGLVNYDETGKDVATHGFKHHIIKTNFTNLESSAAPGESNIINELTKRSTAFWNRMKDNHKLYSGTFKLAICPFIRAGSAVLETSTNREFLVESVEHHMLFGENPQHATTITVSRGQTV